VANWLLKSKTLLLLIMLVILAHMISNIEKESMGSASIDPELLLLPATNFRGITPSVTSCNFEFLGGNCTRIRGGVYPML